MAGNIVPVDLHSTFKQKVRNFPDNLYSFDGNNNITTLMKILLGNSGTGQLKNLQAAARLGQEQIEFSNIDNILGQILQIQRNSSEIYSFATNPFIDQLSASQWDEIKNKDGNYRERLLSAAEAFQTGATIWSVITLCEAMTGIKFYVTESWRTPGYGRGSSGVDTGREIVLIPIIDNNNVFVWDQSKARAITNAINKIVGANLIVSFSSTPLKNFNNVTVTSGNTTDNSEYFFMQPTVSVTTIQSPGTVQAGSDTRYWLKSNAPHPAPYFAHLQTQEISIDLTGNIINVSSSDATGVPYNAVAQPSMEVTSTIYGAQ